MTFHARDGGAARSLQYFKYLTYPPFASDKFANEPTLRKASLHLVYLRVCGKPLVYFVSTGRYYRLSESDKGILPTVVASLATRHKSSVPFGANLAILISYLRCL